MTHYPSTSEHPILTAASQSQCRAPCLRLYSAWTAGLVGAATSGAPGTARRVMGGFVGRRFGADRFQFELVEGWPKQEIKGVAAAIACDSRGRAYVGVRNIPAGGGVGSILPGEGRGVVLHPDGPLHDDWDFKFSSPHSVWVNDQDEVFVADTGLHTITRHAPSGEVLLTLGTPGEPGRQARRSTCRLARFRRRTATSSSRTPTDRTGCTAFRPRAS